MGHDGKCHLTLPSPPCWDESDDGVPPPCRGEPPVPFWKVFNHKNQWTNDNLVMLAFGNVGFRHFDTYRKFYMGFAMWSTFCSIFFTVAGCFALSNDKSILHRVHWTWIKGMNMTSTEEFKIEIGLTALVYSQQPCTPFRCDWHVYDLDGTNWPNEYVEVNLQSCRDEAYGEWFGAFTTCFTLIFALIGTMNRMRFSADAPVQKALGMVR
jgi:hypothetical protein